MNVAGALNDSDCEGEAGGTPRHSGPEADHSLALAHIQGLRQAWLSFDLKLMETVPQVERAPIGPLPHLEVCRPVLPLVSSELPGGPVGSSGKTCFLTRLALAWTSRHLDASVPRSVLECRREGLRPPG